MRGKKQTYKEKLNKIYNDPITRNQVLNHLLTHLSDGLSIESFPDLTYLEVMELVQNPLFPEWNAEDIEKAKRVGMSMWERLGHAQASGKNLGNSRTWFYNMSHRYGWRDRVEAAVEHKGAVAVNIVSYQPPAQS